MRVLPPLFGNYLLFLEIRNLFSWLVYKFLKKVRVIVKQLAWP